MIAISRNGEKIARWMRDPAAWLAGAAGAAVAGWLAFRFGAPLAGWFAFSFTAAWWLVPAVARLAHRVQATVLPGGRSIHTERTALMGGLAILLPLLVGLAFTGDRASLAFGAGCLLMAMIGTLDDLRGLAPRIKILAQVAAALLLIRGGFRLPALDLPPLGALETGPLEYPLLVAWVVLVTNAINLIDGLDGLAGGICLCGVLACAGLGSSALAPALLAGALLGFLRHNLPRARIFLGDAGSLMLGFALAALLLDGPRAMNLPLAIGVLALPLGDVFLSATRRWLRGKPIFTADRGHVHHLLLNLWRSPWRALGALLLFAAVHALLAVRFRTVGGLGLTALVWALFCVFLLISARARWSGILLHRRRFQRAHVVRNYARASIALADTRAEVRSVLDRVAADFQLTYFGLEGIEIRRPPLGNESIEESVECRGSVATWRHEGIVEDPVFLEERHSILCELSRRAADRLRALAVARESRRGGFAVVRPRVHFLLGPGDDHEHVLPLVAETRRSGRLDLCVVNTGRRDEAPLFDALGTGPARPEPDVHLDGDETELVCERYRSLLLDDEPALVVVLGRSHPAVNAAAVAKAQGIAVARLDHDRSRIEGTPASDMTDTLAAAIAQVVPGAGAQAVLSELEGLAGARRES